MGTAVMAGINKLENAITTIAPEVWKIVLRQQYAEAIGIWNHEISGIQHKLIPEMEDNDKLGKAVTEMQKDKDMNKIMNECVDIYCSMVERNNLGLTDIDKKELHNFIGINKMQVMKDLMIQFKWSSEEAMKKAEDMGDKEIKKLLTEQS